MDAVRVLFAELGFEIDEATLRAADARINEVARSMAALTSESSAVGQAVNAAARVAGSAFAEVATTVTQASDAIEKQFLDIEGMREAMAEARDEGMKAAQAGPSVVVSDDLKEEIAQMEAAAKATRDLAEEERKRREAPAKRAAEERADFGAQQAFRGSAAGQDHEAWKREAENLRALQAPVQNLAGAADRSGKVVTQAFGRAMPASVARFAEGLGVARGDTLALGQVILDVSRRGAAGLVALAVSVGVFTTAFAAESEALRETAREARVTSSELQALQHAGAQSGVGADRVTQSVTALGQKLRAANNHLAGSGSTVHMLRRLGINARDASGQIRPTVDILDDVAVAMEHVGSPRRRIRIAESLGLDRRMLEILHTGEGGIRALRAEMAELGGGITPEATEAARRFTQQQERMRVALTSVRSSIFTQLAPTLTDLMQRGGRLFGLFAQMTRGTHVFENAVKILGVALAAAAVPALVAWSPMIVTFGGIALAIGALALAWDDVQHLLEGQPSLIGYLIDQYAGFGASTRIVQALRDAWNGVSDAMVRLKEVVSSWPPWARTLFDVGTLGVRHLLPDERGGGADAGPGGAAPANPSPGAPGAPRAPVVQPGIPAANLAAWRAVNGGAIPATRAVPMPGGAAAGTAPTTINNAGDRNVFNITGNDPAAMRRELERWAAERERRRNSAASGREGA